jgi:hypothetical protein
MMILVWTSAWRLGHGLRIGLAKGALTTMRINWRFTHHKDVLAFLIALSD